MDGKRAGISVLMFFLVFPSGINCQENEAVDLKPAKLCIMLVTQGMDEKQVMQAKDKVYELIDDLPEQTEVDMKLVGDETQPPIIIKSKDDKWKKGVLNMNILSKHVGSVLGHKLELYHQDCFPDIKSPYYVPSKPEISFMVTLSSTDILGTFDTRNKKSYVIFMDDGKLNMSKWLPMATSKRHLLDSDSYHRLLHMLTKDTSLLCDIDKYYSDGRCQKCGVICNGDGPGSPFCTEQNKHCSYYLQHLLDAWEIKYVTKPVEPKSLEIQTPTIRHRPTQPVPKSFNQKHLDYILAGSFGVILALITIAICCFKKYRREQQHKRQGQHIYHLIRGKIVPELELLNLSNTSSPQAARIQDQPLVTPIQPTAPNADPTPRHTPSPTREVIDNFLPNEPTPRRTPSPLQPTAAHADLTPPHTPSPIRTPSPTPGLTDNYQPNTQPVNEDMAGDEPSGSQNIEVVDETDKIARLLRKTEALDDDIPFCNLHQRALEEDG